MHMTKISTFEIFLLVIGLAVAVLGFQLINGLYAIDGVVSWSMVIAIFTWLILIILFIALSLSVDVAKRQLTELRNIGSLLGQKKGRK